jgi:sugar lactone lactonase YvrE
MVAASVLLEGLAFGESPRWHDGALWVCDWGAHELLRVGADGNAEVVARVQSFPFCIDWLPAPDGRLLAVSAADKAVLAIADDGTLATFCALDGLAPSPPNNEIVVHPDGHVYVDGGGFDLGAGEAPAPGYVALIGADGSSARLVADGIEFGNGMAITEDGSTLIVAESYGRRLSAFTIGADGGLSERRVWAELGDGVPDGICLDASGAVWYADVPNQRCQRVREGAEVLDTVEFDRGCFACMLGGDDGRTLYVVAREWHGGAEMRRGDGTGQVLTVRVDVPHAGRP